MPEEERAAKPRCCTLHRAGLPGCRAPRAKSTRNAALLGIQASPPTGLSSGSSLLLVIPGVFPNALSPLFWRALGAPSPRTAELREVWPGLGEQTWEKCSAGVGWRVPVSGHCAWVGVGDSARTGISAPSPLLPLPKRLQGNFADAFLSASGGWLILGEMVCVVRCEDTLLGSTLMKRREVLWVDTRLKKPNPPRRCFYKYCTCASLDLKTFLSPWVLVTDEWPGLAVPDSLSRAE